MSKAVEQLESESVKFYFCHHCGQAELTESEMEPLESGLPSNMCRMCWDEAEALRRSGLPDLLRKWHEDAIANQREGEKREREKQMSKKDKERAESAGHSLYLVK